jgi:hypothetical protein
MPLDSLVGYCSYSEDDADSRGTSEPANPFFSFCWQQCLQRGTDHVRAAAIHRSRQGCQDRISEYLFYKGLHYEMVHPKIG